MNMPGDTVWQAMVNSLRSNLVHLPSMDTAELKGFLPAHTQRTTRIMQMHRYMMTTMKM